MGERMNEREVGFKNLAGRTFVRSFVRRLESSVNALTNSGGTRIRAKVRVANGFSDLEPGQAGRQAGRQALRIEIESRRIGGLTDEGKFVAGCVRRKDNLQPKKSRAFNDRRRENRWCVAMRVRGPWRARVIVIEESRQGPDQVPSAGMAGRPAEGVSHRTQRDDCKRCFVRGSPRHYFTQSVSQSVSHSELKRASALRGFAALCLC